MYLFHSFVRNKEGVPEWDAGRDLKMERKKRGTMRDRGSEMNTAHFTLKGHQSILDIPAGSYQTAPNNSTTPAATPLAQ